MTAGHVPKAVLIHTSIHLIYFSMGLGYDRSTAFLAHFLGCLRCEWHMPTLSGGKVLSGCPGDTCKICPEGTWAGAGFDSCYTCPKGKTVRPGKGEKASMCFQKCPIGKYGNIYGDCTDCPIGQYAGTPIENFVLPVPWGASRQPKRPQCALSVVSAKQTGILE